MDQFNTTRLLHHSIAGDSCLYITKEISTTIMISVHPRYCWDTMAHCLTHNYRRECATPINQFFQIGVNKDNFLDCCKSFIPCVVKLETKQNAESLKIETASKVIMFF